MSFAFADPESLPLRSALLPEFIVKQVHRATVTGMNSLELSVRITGHLACQTHADSCIAGLLEAWEFVVRFWEPLDLEPCSLEELELGLLQPDSPASQVWCTLSDSALLQPLSMTFGEHTKTSGKVQTESSSKAATPCSVRADGQKRAHRAWRCKSIQEHRGQHHVTFFIS